MGAKERVLVCVALFVATFFTTSLIDGLFMPSAFASRSSVKTVGVKVYRERACVNEATSIDWGAVEAGSSKSITVYVRNTGDATITLSLSTVNWNPLGASNYITLGWDYSGQSIKRAKVIQVKLTLSLSQSITEITDFTFDLIITGNG